MKNINLWHISLSLSIFISASCSGSNPAEVNEISKATEIAVGDLNTGEGAVDNLGNQITVEIWLPHIFDPNADTPAGNLLNDRLIQFSELNPGTRINVRLKSSEGVSSILNSLNAASEAAPLALPDLILLERSDLESAVSSELVFPIDALLTDLEDEDWYPYAVEMGKMGEQIYGIPFSADALILYYRPAVVSDAPPNWNKALSKRGPLAFPAADEKALTTFAFYLGEGKTLHPENGDIAIDKESLATLFTFYKDGLERGVFPFWLTQFDNDDLSWQAFREGRAIMAISWARRYFQDELSNVGGAPIPSSGGEPSTLATGWVWALSGPQLSRQTEIVKLAEFLSEADFIAQWTEAAGYLPPRPSALAKWEETSKQALASQINSSAILIPSYYLRESLGPIVTEATISLLKNEIEVDEAADQVINNYEQR